MTTIWYSFQDGALWKQERAHVGTPHTKVIRQWPIPFTLDATRSYDEMVFTSMLRDFFAGDQLAELQASVMGSRIVKMFPNKVRVGNWTISEHDISLAVIEALVRHKIAVMVAPIAIEYIGGQRSLRDASGRNPQ